VGLRLRVFSCSVVPSDVVCFDGYTDSLRFCRKYNILWGGHYASQNDRDCVYFAWCISANKISEVTPLCSASVEEDMDPFLVKLIVCVVALVSLIVGAKIILWKYGKERCIRCYGKFVKSDLTKAPGFRGDFWVCQPCADVIEHYKDQQ